MLLLYAIPAGVFVGLLGGGRLAELAKVRIRFWPLALGGLAFQLLLFSPAVASAVGIWGPLLYVGSTLVVLLVLLANIGQPGFRLILLGSTLNLVAILLNGGQMPASAEAIAALNGLAQLPADAFSNSALAGPNTQFAILGDIFALPRPIPFANVFSIGDVLIGVGGAWFIGRTMVASSPTPAQPVSGAHTVHA
jgi:hypothetical protein